MKVFIITEGGKKIGYGHIARGVSLCQAFKEAGIESEFIVNGDKSIRDLLEGRRCHIYNWHKDIEKLISIVKNGNIAIIDSYLADITAYKKISETAKIPLFIDDTQRIEYPKGIVVNGGIYAEELGYQKKNTITYLLGARYIPLRRVFWDVPKKKIKKRIGSVMITFGGDDVRNMTPKVLSLLCEGSPELNKKVIIGGCFQNIKDIEGRVDKNTDLFYFPAAEDMKRVMLESDVAVSAGGQTLYELARIGVPTIAVAIADNQMNNINGWKKKGFIQYAGWWKNKEVMENITYSLKLLEDKCLRGRASKTGRSLVDGQGARRIVGTIMKATHWRKG